MFSLLANFTEMKLLKHRMKGRRTMQQISRRSFLRRSMASAVGLGVMGSPLKSWARFEECDFCIIGSGASGSIVARRLYDAGYTVLLLEAGGPDTSTELVPPFCPAPGFCFPQETINDAIRSLELHSLFSLWPPSAPGFVEWGFSPEVERYLDPSDMIPLIAGKVVGGGDSINGRISFRGDPRTYDYWERLGNEGWGYDDVLPYFKKFEDYRGPAGMFGTLDNTGRGFDGPIPIITPAFQSEAAQAFVEAALSLGSPKFNQVSFATKQENTVNFTESNTDPNSLTRVSSAIGYIDGIGNKPNFTLLTDVLVTQVLIEHGRAIGVEYLDSTGGLHTVRATSEVIICAGAYNTPKLLMLSGIGPAEQLRSFGIPVVVNLPGVGQNLQDHTLVRMAFSLDQGLSASDALTKIETIAEASLFTKVLHSSPSDPSDLQLFCGGFTFQGTPGATLVPVTAQQESVGSVSLRSANPQDKPVIIHNYLQSERDIKVLLAGVDLCRELFDQKAFDDIRGSGTELPPSAGLTTKKDLIEEFLRTSSTTDWHPSCSCRMGHDRMAVVDPQLRVRGLTGLRVVDASVMPRIPSGNIHLTCYMIGEKGAAMILTGQS
jgi:choline dehydrogenase